MAEENGTEEETTPIASEVELVTSVEIPEDADDGTILVEAVKNSKKAVIPYCFGADLDDMVSRFTAEVVFSQARAQMKIKLQAAMRGWILAGKECAELTEKFIPGVALERIVTTTPDTAEKMFESLPADEQAAFIERLRAKIQ